MRRASLSILSNIAEGSAGELRAQLIACEDIGYLKPAEALALIDPCSEVSRMLAGLIDSRKPKAPPNT